MREGNDRLKSQSAFSLIEVMVSLLILSFALTGVASLIVENKKWNNIALIREKGVIFAWNVAESLHHATPNNMPKIVEYWQSKLEETLPRSTLDISPLYLENSCSYTIVITFPNPDVAPVKLQKSI